MRSDTAGRSGAFSEKKVFDLIVLTLIGLTAATLVATMIHDIRNDDRFPGLAPEESEWLAEFFRL